MPVSTTSTRVLAWASRASVTLAILAVIFQIFFIYGINASWLGAHDLGITFAFAVGATVLLIGATCAVPVFFVAGAICFGFQRQTGWRFFAAAAICVLPMIVFSLQR